MPAWVRILLSVIGFVSVAGLIGVQLYTRTTFLAPDHAVERDRQRVLYWVILGLQLFFLVTAIVFFVIQSMLGM